MNGYLAIPSIHQAGGKEAMAGIVFAEATHGFATSNGDGLHRRVAGIGMNGTLTPL